MYNDILKSKFGFDTFRPGQEEIIASVLDFSPVLGVLPTATGKSLCYQLPAYLMSGAAIIVSPLISLMDDQILQLRKLGEKNMVAINSNLSLRDRQWVLNNISQYKFIFISPEAISQKNVLKVLKRIKIGLFVVDEAHCISQWGIDFRPEYESLTTVYQQLQPKSLLALTATADEQTTLDIIDKLFNGDDKLKVIRESSDRPNIAYFVEETEDKMDFLINFLRENQGSGIIYFSSRQMCEQVALALNQVCAQKISYYHGGMSQTDRHLIQQQYLNGQLDILCATSAFGMGINKPNIRFVIHYHLPNSLEAYIQEAGRAGRDGQQSVSLILYQPFDERIHRFQMADLESAVVFLEKTNDLKVSQQHPEIYNKWIEDLEHGKYTKEYLIRSLLIKQKTKKRSLFSMVDYINTHICRREFILMHFNETKKEKLEYCCDKCSIYDKIIVMSDLKVNSESIILTSWDEKLKNLFNL